MKYVYNLLFSFLCSSSLNYWFNLGSMLGMALFLQIISGLFLLMNYNALESYESILFITMEVNYGWFMKLFHSNNASFIFLCLYLHLYKAMAFSSWRVTSVWNSGLVMMLMLMGAGFSGYVLVGSQMSLWAAMVITSLISVFPLNGNNLMYFVWGGYSISWVTLQTLMLVHFILPFLVMFTMMFHLNSLHKVGSTNIIYSHSKVEKVSFFPYFWAKDMMNILVYMVFLVLMLLYPYALGEVELFEESNILSSPAHIVPEWYFCVSYAILRSVPSKGMGVLMMMSSIFILFLYPLMSNYMTPGSAWGTSMWTSVFVLQTYLTYLGFSPIAQPFVMLSMLSMYFYFLFHLWNMWMMLLVEYVYMVTVSVGSSPALFNTQWTVFGGVWLMGITLGLPRATVYISSRNIHLYPNVTTKLGVSTCSPEFYVVPLMEAATLVMNKVFKCKVETLNGVYTTTVGLKPHYYKSHLILSNEVVLTISLNLVVIAMSNMGLTHPQASIVFKELNNLTLSARVVSVKGFVFTLSNTGQNYNPISVSPFNQKMPFNFVYNAKGLEGVSFLMAVESTVMPIIKNQMVYNLWNPVSMVQIMERSTEAPKVNGAGHK